MVSLCTLCGHTGVARLSELLVVNGPTEHTPNISMRNDSQENNKNKYCIFCKSSITQLTNSAAGLGDLLF